MCIAVGVYYAAAGDATGAGYATCGAVKLGPMQFNATRPTWLNALKLLV